MSGRKARQARRAQPQPKQQRRFFSERRLAYAAAAVALVAVVVGGIAIAHKNSGANRIVSASGPANGISQASGTVPALRGTNPIDGSQVSLTQFAGKPVVLNVWASWCTGCNQEAADLQRFAVQHPAVQVLGIDTQDTTGGAQAFYRRWNWQHPSIADPNGSLLSRFAVTGLPTTYFLDRQHRVVASIVGAGDLAEFDQGLQLALRR